MKKLFLSLLVVLLPMVAMADAVEIDGIYYNLVSKANAAEVTSNPNKYSGSVNIPASVYYEGVEFNVTTIGSSAFYKCNGLTSVIIPNSVSSIGNSAFSFCSILTSIILPNSVTSIGDYAFRDCINMTSVTIPNSVTAIGIQAFLNCSGLSSITIPNSLKSISMETFWGCTGLLSVNIPNSVISIGVGAFKNCTSLTSVTIPNSVKSLENYSFYNCSSMTSVILGNCLSSIKMYVFKDCSSLTSVNIPNSVESIGQEAFSNCSAMTSVFLGSAVNKIYSLAFANCKDLKNVYCLADRVPQTNSNVFQGSYTEYATLHVPEESVNSYMSTEPWKNFLSIVSLEGETPESPKCATPTISYQNGHLIFESETEGVEFVTDITDNDIKRHYDSKISLTATYNITVYASKSGYDNSDVATATLCWIDQQPETDGIADGLAQIPSRPVLIKTDSRVITVEGVDDQTNITLFTSDGKLAGSAISQNGSASIDTHLPSNTTAIVKIGGKSVKVVVR